MKVDRDAIEAFRRRRARRLDARGCGVEPDREDYGTKSSGNWGHVGRPGIRGGSAAGGGGAFRMTNHGTKTPSFTSKAKIQAAARKKTATFKKELRAAKASGNADRIMAATNRLQKQLNHNSKINMVRKSAKRLMAAGKFSKTASKDILRSKTRGKRAWEKQAANVSGTRSAIKATFNKTRKRW